MTREEFKAHLETLDRPELCSLAFESEISGVTLDSPVGAPDPRADEYGWITEMDAPALCARIDSEWKDSELEGLTVGDMLRLPRSSTVFRRTLKW